MKNKIKAALLRLARFTVADDDHGLAGEYTEPETVQGNWAYERNEEPFSRRQIEELAAEQHVRFPRSSGPHTIG